DQTEPERLMENAEELQALWFELQDRVIRRLNQSCPPGAEPIPRVSESRDRRSTDQILKRLQHLEGEASSVDQRFSMPSLCAGVNLFGPVSQVEGVFHGEPARYSPTSWRAASDSVVGHVERAREALDRWVEEHGVDSTDGFLPADSPSQWAKKLKMSYSTLKRHIDNGRIRAEKITLRSWRIHGKDAARHGYTPK
ncbi:MAG: hypothetical protein QGG36_21375, partial [Pirellulaceae bacterium]|nr:hypothetical protein [Pirellulaceae bacterium]